MLLLVPKGMGVKLNRVMWRVVMYHDGGFLPLGCGCGLCVTHQDCGPPV